MQDAANRGGPDTMWATGHDKKEKGSYQGMPLGIPFAAGLSSAPSGAAIIPTPTPRAGSNLPVPLDSRPQW
jgi:hypothetical protein